MNLQAQNYIDLANVYWRNSPLNQTPNGDGNRFNFDLFGADLKIPVELNKRNALIIGSEYLHSRFTSNSGRIVVSSLSLQLGYQHKWNDGFRSLFMVIPKISSHRLSNPLNTTFQMGGLVLNTKNRSDQFSWKFGLYYNEEFYGPLFVPLFGFDWKFRKSHRLRIIAPIDLEYVYTTSTKFKMRYGLRFIGVNASYQLQNNLYLDKADNNIWLFSDFYLTKNVVLHLKAGHSILRKYRIYTMGEKVTAKIGPSNINDDRPNTNPLFNEGWSFESRLTFRLGLTDRKLEPKKD
jgi:hypothetical protein